MPLCKTEAVVIKAVDWHETSKIITFYTKEYGKIKGVAKGARRGKFGSSLEILTYNDIVFYEREGKDLYTISQCDLKESFLGIRQDIKRLAYASYTVELVDKATGAQENPPTFDLLVRTLRLMEDSKDIEALARVFEVKLLTHLGYRLHLDDCSICHREFVGPRFKFSLRAGGIICPGHPQPGQKISRDTLAFLRGAQRLELAKIDRSKISHNLRGELKSLLASFIAYHIGPRLKSREFIDALEEINPQGT